MNRLTLSIFLLTLIILPLTSFAETDLVTTNVLQRVFFIKYGDQSGSSFTIDVDNKQYLISAKHFLTNLKSSDTIEIFHESTWKRLDITRIDLNNPNIDIIVLAPKIQLSPALKLDPSIGNITLSQKVFFLGFPFGMNTDIKELNNFFPLPFVKAGIVSAMDFANAKEKILYVDGQNNPGFSGGPIVLYDAKEKRLKVVAVISGYRVQEDNVYAAGQITMFKAAANAGILMGYTIDHAVEAIKKNPIGVEIKK